MNLCMYHMGWHLPSNCRGQSSLSDSKNQPALWGWRAWPWALRSMHLEGRQTGREVLLRYRRGSGGKTSKRSFRCLQETSPTATYVNLKPIRQVDVQGPELKEKLL